MMIGAPAALPKSVHTEPARILKARVMHKRLGLAANAFRYRLCYLALPLESLGALTTPAINKRGFVSFHVTDHGPKDGSPLLPWLQARLDEAGITEQVEKVLLVAMPRTLGHVFNPVSFWLCLDRLGQLRAVLCEVNNTFGQSHSYLCFNQDFQPVTGKHWLSAQKQFHVSPFFPRSGHYRFKFDLREHSLSIWMHYFDSQGQRKLVTALKGEFYPLTKKAMAELLLRHGMIGIKTLALIHWQALKLLLKKARFYRLPEQRKERLTLTQEE